MGSGIDKGNKVKEILDAEVRDRNSITGWKRFAVWLAQFSTGWVHLQPTVESQKNKSHQHQLTEIPLETQECPG